MNTTQACADHVNGDGTAVVCPNTECGLAVCGINNEAFHQPLIHSTSHGGGHPAPVTTNAPWGFGGAGLASVLVLATLGIVIARRHHTRPRRDDDNFSDKKDSSAKSRQMSPRVRVLALASVLISCGLLLVMFLPSPAHAAVSSQLVPAPTPTAPCGPPVYKSCAPPIDSQIVPAPVATTTTPPCGAPVYQPCATPTPQLGPGGIEPTGGPIAPQPSGLPQVHITPLPAPQPLQNTQQNGNAPWGVGGFTNSMMHWLGLPGNMAEVRRQQAGVIRTQMKTERVLVHVPDITRNARVRQLWFIMFLFSDAFLLLTLPLAGLFAMWWDVTQINWKEILPRYAAAVLATNLSLWSVQRILHVTNAITSSLASAGVTADLVSPSKEFSFWLAAGIIVVLVILIASDLIRVALLLIGVALAAPTQIAWMAFDKDNIARGWWKFMFFLFGSTIIQAILTTAAMWTIWSGQSFLSAGTAIDTWLLIVILLIIAAIPIVLLIKAITSLGGHAKVHGVRVGKVALGV